MKTCCYIKNFATHDALTADPKALIPDTMLRRRMSRMVKMGVMTGLECLQGRKVDAIVTATGFGCLADSEKFLRNMLEQDEGLLNPTPFIQSTFNTIGAQIALLCGCHGSNTTFSQRGQSFESALVEASMLLADEPCRNILVGAADEQTPSQHRIMDRMNLWKDHKDGEGATFLLLSGVPSAQNKACITGIHFPQEQLDPRQIIDRYSTDQVLCPNPLTDGCYPTVAARTLVEAISLLNADVRRVAIYSRYLDKRTSIIIISACQ